MKKIKVTMIIVFAVLFSCLFTLGCKDDGYYASFAQGKVIILQAYGNAGDGSPAGVSHSFVELYNISDGAIDLSGIGLYYANGKGSLDANEDDPWERISLDGKTIPAKGSLLVLGAKHGNLSGTRYKITDGYGDINDNNLSLSRRGFKVALIESTAQLTEQNPFNNGPVSGYIDMVGTANQYQERDLIFGFETAPARNSASEAVRRTYFMDRVNFTDIDTDDNSTDFIAARYASDGMSAEELEARRPRNSSAGNWSPFAEPAWPNPTVAGTQSPLAGKLLILQVYGTGTATDGAVSHSFIELYNNTDSPVNLNTYSLQYANASGTNWTVINLTGTIPAKGSYLVRGNNNNASGRLQLGTADQTVDFYLDNNNFKVALMANRNKLTVENPFAMTGGKAKDYVDMVGVKNGNNDDIDGYETALAQVISKQAAARRKNLTDSDNNNTDFERIDYRSSGISNQLLAVRKPRSSSNGNWNPFEEPEAVAGSPKLMILQANTYGNDNGGGGGFPSSLVELYNNTNTGIDLSGYYLHIGSNGSAWSQVIPLSGTIPAQCSFLIVASADSSTNGQRALLPPANITAIFTLGNNNFKVALMRNRSTPLSVDNPFTEPSLSADYVDMLGVGTANGFETAVASTTRPQGPRRRSLNDSDNNSADFAQADFRGTSGSNGVANGQLYTIWPRNSSAGPWDPTTGLPAVHPTFQ